MNGRLGEITDEDRTGVLALRVAPGQERRAGRVLRPSRLRTAGELDVNGDEVIVLLALS